MNPFEEYKKKYIAACFIVAVIYAFSLGGSLLFFTGGNDPTSTGLTNRLIFCIADGFIYGCILCLTGIILWNIFRFVIPTNYNFKYRFFFVSILAVFTCLFVIASESLAIYLCFPKISGYFVHSIPARLFIALLFFIITRLFYIFYQEKNRNTGEVSGITNGETSGETVFHESAISDFNIPANSIPKNVEPSNTEKSTIDRITVRNGQKIIIIPINEIIFIKADGDYISINTTKGNWLKEQTMKYTEDSLPAYSFVRIHRSYIVNINHISRIERYGEKQQIVLHNNVKIKISAARYQILKQVLGL